MEPTNNNPTASVGDQGSQDFASMIGNPTPTPTTPTQTAVPSQNASTPASPAPTQEFVIDTTKGDAPVQTQTAPVVPQQSHADIIKATADAIVNAQQRATQTQQQAQAPRTNADLSPQEFNNKFKVVQVTEKHVADLLNQDPKVAAASLNSLLQGTVQQAVLMALEIADANVAKVKSDFEPDINSWRSYENERRQKAAEDRFFKTHADLANERELVMELKDAFIARVRAGQVSFKDETEAFSAVAAAARNILTRVRGGAQGGQSANPATGQQANGRQMSAASSAGRSGTGAATAKSDVDLIFGAEAR